MPNVMAALLNIGGALCSMPQSLPDAHYSRGARGAVRAPPSGFMGTIIFLFFRSLSMFENLSSRKKTVIFHVYYIKIKTAYMHLKIVLLEGVT